MKNTRKQRKARPGLGACITCGGHGLKSQLNASGECPTCSFAEHYDKPFEITPEFYGQVIYGRMQPSIDKVVELFTQVNADCAKTGESVVPFSDTEYYVDQIVNIFEVNEVHAEWLARAMSQKGGA